MASIATDRMSKFISGATGACLLLASSHAWSWGHTGHVEISRIAIEKLPDEIPFFVRNGLAAAAIGELGPEADESKTTGVITGVAAPGVSRQRGQSTMRSATTATSLTSTTMAS